jgi:hypothetical protein
VDFIMGVVKNFDVTEDTCGVISISIDDGRGRFIVRSGYEGKNQPTYRKKTMSGYNALLYDVRMILAGCDALIESAGASVGAAQAAPPVQDPVGAMMGPTLLANERGVYPSRYFSRAARMVMMNADDVTDDEWSALREFYSWDDWFARQKKVFIAPFPERARVAQERGAASHLASPRSLTIAPVVFAGESWCG